MKGNFKIAASVFGYLLVAGFMCIICYMSMKMIFNFVFTDTVGYEVRGSKEGSEEKEYLYTFYYDDNKTNDEDDTKWAEYEEQGYTLYKYAERTKLSARTNAAMVIITQIICVFTAGAFMFEIFTKRGYKDGTLVRSGSKKADVLKGLKIGLMASVPALISFIVFIVFASANKGVAVELYMIVNACFWPILELLLTSAKTAGDIAIWQFIIMFLIQTIIPLLAELFYYIGYKDYQFLNKIVYKKKKG